MLLARASLLSALLLAPMLASAEFRCVRTQKANVREEPGGAVSWVAERHTPLFVVALEDGWAKVTDVDGDEAWVHPSVLSRGRCVAVSVERAKLRSGPGTRYEVLWKVERYYPFRVVDTRGPWIEVSDGEGVEGWVARSSVWGLEGGTGES